MLDLDTFLNAAWLYGWEASVRLGRDSLLSTKGLMSRIGVPSNMSMQRTCSTLSFFFSTSRTDNPIGFGRLGEQMLNTPKALSRFGGVCLNRPREKGGLLWKWNNTTILWPTVMSASASVYWGSITSAPSTSDTVQWRGMSAAFVCAVPMGFNVICTFVFICRRLLNLICMKRDQGIYILYKIPDTIQLWRITDGPVNTRFCICPIQDVFELGSSPTDWAKNQ